MVRGSRSRSVNEKGVQLRGLLRVARKTIYEANLNLWEVLHTHTHTQTQVEKGLIIVNDSVSNVSVVLRATTKT